MYSSFGSEETLTNALSDPKRALKTRDNAPAYSPMDHPCFAHPWRTRCPNRGTGWPLPRGRRGPNAVRTSLECIGRAARRLPDDSDPILRPLEAGGRPVHPVGGAGCPAQRRGRSGLLSPLHQQGRPEDRLHRVVLAWATALDCVRRPAGVQPRRRTPGWKRFGVVQHQQGL
jgi:hypothetical protein